MGDELLGSALPGRAVAAAAVAAEFLLVRRRSDEMMLSAASAADVDEEEGMKRAATVTQQARAATTSAPSATTAAHKRKVSLKSVEDTAVVHPVQMSACQKWLAAPWVMAAQPDAPELAVATPCRTQPG